MHPDTMITRRAGLMEAAIGPDLVALDVDGGHCFGFNRTATAAWQLLERPMRFDDLTAAMVIRHEVDPATCAHDLAELVAGMQVDGLVTLVPQQ